MHQGSVIRRVGFIALAALTWIGSGTAHSYEEITVGSGGKITGKVALTGTPPPARIFHLVFSPNMDFCGKISDGKGTAF